jgi:hypothetical protein
VVRLSGSRCGLLSKTEFKAIDRGRRQGTERRTQKHCNELKHCMEKELHCRGSHN